MSSRSPKQPDKTTTDLVGLFYGYSSYLIEKWCDVSRATACAWKKGTRMPSRRSVKLFKLYAKGQVVTDRFRGWMFNAKSGNLVGPSDREYSPGEIESIGLRLQEIAALRRELKEAQEAIEEFQLQLNPKALEQKLIDTSDNVVRIRR